MSLAHVGASGRCVDASKGCIGLGISKKQDSFFLEKSSLRGLSYSAGTKGVATSRQNVVPVSNMAPSQIPQQKVKVQIMKTIV